MEQIYEDYGYTAREAAQKIVQHNLHGLDIDPRAVQLSYFAVMMKARHYDRRFFSRNIQPMVYSPEGYPEGMEYGSLITVDELEPAPDFDNWTLHDGDYLTALNRWSFRYVLHQKYHVLVTNPPYMGSSNMNPSVNQFIKDRYTDYKSDFFSAFIVHGSELTYDNGFCGFFSPYVWMFIQSYEKLRQHICKQCAIETLIQFEYSAFEEATVPVCTFAFRNRSIPKRKGVYLRLSSFRGGMEIQRIRTLEAIENHDCGFYYEKASDSFSKIPGAPIAYWVNLDNNNFDCIVGDEYNSGGRNKTHNDAKYTRFHWEVTPNKSKWRIYLNGGDYRQYYGNNTEVVLWTKEAQAEYKSHGGLLKQSSIDSTGVYWGKITSSTVGFLYKEKDWIFSSVAPSLLSNGRADGYNLLAYLNSKVGQYYLRIINPTMTTNAGDVQALPFIKPITSVVETIVQDCITLSRTDWDSFETSWAFIVHPFITIDRAYIDGAFAVASIAHYYQEGPAPSCPLEACFLLWQNECNGRFLQLKQNEEELNRIFIDIYGLRDELTPEVEDKDVTVRKADLQREIRSFISYAVGCMFGRYSLDMPGLAFAGGNFSDRFINAGNPLTDENGDLLVDENGDYLSDGENCYSVIRVDGEEKLTTFAPDYDNILPICDDEYFEDDIVRRFVEFVETVYGKDTLEENLKYIADALGSKGSPREVIRNYFLNDFYTDHLKVYQKRPIYWLFDSGKKNGFKCLIYMHRYQPDTIARIRTDYVHELQSRYRTAIDELERRISDAATAERVKLNKQLAKLQAQADELRDYEEKIHHLADQMIPIDLDDGVKVNYAKFQDVLAKIK